MLQEQARRDRIASEQASKDIKNENLRKVGKWALWGSIGLGVGASLYAIADSDTENLAFLGVLGIIIMIPSGIVLIAGLWGVIEIYTE